MDPLRMAAVTTVTVALGLYTVGSLREMRERRASAAVRGLLGVGVVFDVTATALMILASGTGMTIHGLLGYSALALMASDTFLIWRHAKQHGDAPIGKGLHLYSRIAYIYWVVAYFTGAALVMMAKRAAGA
jgi:hypothetical protein